MAAQIKELYAVYYGSCFMQNTWAVSEAQAINNVRHNTDGDVPTNEYYRAILVHCANRDNALIAARTELEREHNRRILQERLKARANTTTPQETKPQRQEYEQINLWEA